MRRCRLLPGIAGGEQTIEGDLTKLKHLVDTLVAGGYVTDTSSKHFEASYTPVPRRGDPDDAGTDRLAASLKQ